MERSTLLSALWNATDADSDPNQVAEQTRLKLESGELIPTGNFRNVERAYWAREKD